MSLADFLAAKYPLDQRSLNPAVRGAWVQCLQGMPMAACLDAGAGTGATVRRMLQWRSSQPWCLTLLERERDLIERARGEALQALTEHGCRPAWRGDRLESEDGRFAVRFAACELEAYRPQTAFDAIVAHAVMDLLPLAPALERFAQWLRPGGCLYATIDYDGETLVRPPYCDPAFEAELAVCYDQSMERRKLRGEATGGAYCGRRLQALLPRHGFEIVCAGASDWHIVPDGDRYPDEDEACLTALIGLIAKEAVASDRFEIAAVARWHDDRLQSIRRRQLGMHVRNRDVLARYAGLR